MEDHPTGGAVSRPVDKPSQTLSSTPDWIPKTKSTVETPEVPGGSCDCCIKLKKKKKANNTAFLGHGTPALATVMNLQGVRSPFKTDQKPEHAIIPPS